MNRFAELLDRLAYEPGRNNKIRLIADYLRKVEDPDRGYALAALTGALSFIYPIAAIFVDWFAFGHQLQTLQWIGVAAILLAAAGMQQGWGLKARRLAAQ